jgi:hypothetical protein
MQGGFQMDQERGVMLTTISRLVLAAGLVTVGALAASAIEPIPAGPVPFGPMPVAPMPGAPMVPPIPGAERRAEIRSMDILERPYRVGHFYGNTVRRRHHRVGEW